MEAPSPVTSCLNILRRTPPSDTDQNVAGLFTLLSPNEDAAAELLQRVDVPLKDATDPLVDDRPYLLCDHNRDGDSHRSPWSNTYYPPLEVGMKPSQRLRKIETHANEVFDAYRELYYGKQSVSSVYLWDLQEDGVGSSFAGSFLIQKSIQDEQHVKEGFWNSIHVVEVGDVKGGTALYKLTSTIIISMEPSADALGKTEIAGSLTRQTEELCPVSDDPPQAHIANIGKMIEDIEIEMRSSMDSLYIQKTKEVIESIRKPGGAAPPTQGLMHTMMLNQAILARSNNK